MFFLLPLEFWKALRSVVFCKQVGHACNVLTHRALAPKNMPHPKLLLLAVDSELKSRGTAMGKQG